MLIPLTLLSLNIWHSIEPRLIFNAPVSIDISNATRKNMKNTYCVVPIAMVDLHMIQQLRLFNVFVFHLQIKGPTHLMPTLQCTGFIYLLVLAFVGSKVTILKYPTISNKIKCRSIDKIDIWRLWKCVKSIARNVTQDLTNKKIKNMTQNEKQTSLFQNIVH